MKTLTRTLMVALVGLAFADAASAQIIPLKDPETDPAVEESADAEKYLLIGISNTTSSPLTYFFRWGESGEWSSVTLLPGYTWYHWLTFADQAVEDLPKFYVRFDADMHTGQDWTYYFLDGRVTSTNPEESPEDAREDARYYRFVYPEQRDQRFVDVISEE